MSNYLSLFGEQFFFGFGQPGEKAVAEMGMLQKGNRNRNKRTKTQTRIRNRTRINVGLSKSSAVQSESLGDQTKGTQKGRERARGKAGHKLSAVCLYV